MRMLLDERLVCYLISYCLLIILLKLACATVDGEGGLLSFHGFHLVGPANDSLCMWQSGPALILSAWVNAPMHQLFPFRGKPCVHGK